MDLDQGTETLVDQLYHAWSIDAPPSYYASLRDGLLELQEHVDTRITTFKAVLDITCPAIATNERHFDPKWERLFLMAESVEMDDDCSVLLGKRKRTYNHTMRLRNLAFVASLWSSRVVWHYKWHLAAQGQMQLLRACAQKFPRFQADFCPRLNCILLNRHREAIRFGRAKALNEAALQPHRDLNVSALECCLPDPENEKVWITNRDGAVPVDSDGTLLKHLRPRHYHLYLLQKDCNGMLVSRTGSASTMDVGISASDNVVWTPPSEVTTPGGPYSPMDPYGYGNEFGASLYRDAPQPTIAPLALLKHPIETNFDDPYSIDATCSSGPESLVSFHSPTENDCASEASTHTEVSTEHDLEHEDTFLDSSFGSPKRPSDPSLEHADSGRLESTRRAGTRLRRSRCQASEDFSTAQSHEPRRATVGLLRPAMSSRTLAHDSLCLNAPPVKDKPKLSLEESLHNKHRELLASYSKRLSDEAAGGGDRHYIRAQWLTQSTKWARVWTPENGDLPMGTAALEQDAEVLYYSSRQFIAVARTGKVFQKPVVIREKFADAGMHTLCDFALMLEDTSPDATLSVRGLARKGPFSMDLEDFTASLRGSVEACQDSPHAPHLRHITHAHRPLFTLLSRFRLLESLMERLPIALGHGSSLADDFGTARFNSVALAGAFSGPHVDGSCGKWVRLIHGPELVMIVPEQEMDWVAFAAAGDNWTPNGKQRLILLEEDDVLFIPPGLRIVHAFHSPGVCLSESGMLWDELAVISTLQTARWTFQHSGTTEKTIILHQLPYIVHELKELLKRNPDRFRGDTILEDFRDSFDREAKASEDLDCLCGMEDGPLNQLDT